MPGLKTFHKVIFLIGLALYALLTITFHKKGFSLVTMVSVITFASYMLVLLNAINRPIKFYKSSRLALTVFVYQIVIVSLFFLLSYMYDGDSFLFSKIDAKIYEYYSLKMAEMPYDHALSYISEEYQFDDWGAFFMMSTILKIIPSKLFLNFCYVIFGTVMSVLLYGVGKRIMPRNYAYLASLAYSTSSFSVYFNGTFLKEPFFLLLVASSLSFFYVYVQRKTIVSLLLSFAFSLFILFFRPAVMLFLWASYMGYFLVSNSLRIPKVVKVLVVAIIGVLLFSQMTELYNKYTLEGDIEAIAESRAEEDKGMKAGGFMYSVIGVGTLIGPFPTIIQPSTGTPRGPLYGVGLLYKMFLALPFWLGFYYAIKRKTYEVYPLLILVIVECLPLILIQQGLELRKGIPHVCAFYLTAFWFFYQASVRKREGRVLNFLMKYNYIFICIIILGWNLLRK